MSAIIDSPERRILDFFNQKGIHDIVKVADVVSATGIGRNTVGKVLKKFVSMELIRVVTQVGRSFLYASMHTNEASMSPVEHPDWNYKPPSKEKYSGTDYNRKGPAPLITAERAWQINMRQLWEYLQCTDYGNKVDDWILQLTGYVIVLKKTDELSELYSPKTIINYAKDGSKKKHDPWNPIIGKLYDFCMEENLGWFNGRIPNDVLWKKTVEVKGGEENVCRRNFLSIETYRRSR